MKNKIIKLRDYLTCKFKTNENTTEYHNLGMKGPIDYIVMAFCTVAVFVAYYRYAFTLMATNAGTDLNCHADFAVEFYMKWDQFKKAWIRVPYMLWHLVVKFFESNLDYPLSDATAMTYALFGVLTLFITMYFVHCLIKTYVGDCTYRISMLAAVALSFVGPYAKWWFTPISRYLGQFSPNPFHNPTHMAVKGIGMITAMAGIDIIRKLKDEKTIFFCKGRGLYVIFSISLLVSTLAKPTFMYMLLPSGAAYMIGYLIYSLVKRNKKAAPTLIAILNITVASIPSLVLLLLEYLAFYKWGDQYPSEVVFGNFLSVWHMFSNDVPTSVLLAMCFVIWMVITNPKFFFGTTEGLLSLICYIVGTFEFAFISEAGDKASAANFAWCMMAGMTVIYATSVAKLIINTAQKNDKKLHNIYILISWILLLMHVYSGYDFLMETVRLLM